MSARLPAEPWMFTLGLSGLALLAALIAPRLAGSSEIEATQDASAEVAACVRLGPYECCYDPQD